MKKLIRPQERLRNSKKTRIKNNPFLRKGHIQKNGKTPDKKEKGYTQKETLLKESPKVLLL